MRCPFCFEHDSKVLDSRLAEDGFSVRRRRKCLSCGGKFTTFEREEPAPLFVLKKNSKKECFDRNKLRSGFVKACEKRPVSLDQLEGAIARIERELRAEHEHEVSSRQIGEKALKELLKLDRVAYIRFASVYMQFDNIENFESILTSLTKESQHV